jgi:hypothetical protein
MHRRGAREAPAIAVRRILFGVMRSVALDVSAGNPQTSLRFANDSHRSIGL